MIEANVSQNQTHPSICPSYILALLFSRLQISTTSQNIWTERPLLNLTKRAERMREALASLRSHGPHNMYCTLTKPSPYCTISFPFPCFSRFTIRHPSPSPSTPIISGHLKIFLLKETLYYKTI